MSIVPETVKCDGCGKNRIEDGNHWQTLVLITDKRLEIQRGLGGSMKHFHSCGASCTQKLVSRWLQTGKVTE